MNNHGLANPASPVFARGMVRRLFLVALGLACAVNGILAEAPAADRIVARIALLSDTHTTRGATGEQPLYRARLDKVIAAANEAKVDLVLIAGDLTKDGKPEELSDFRNQIKGFHAPVWFVPGNHDLGNKRIAGQSLKSEHVAAERVASFERALGPSYFARGVAGLRVIGVNSPILGSGLPVEAAMWDFLASQRVSSPQVTTLALMHYPPFVTSADEPGGEYWNIEPEPRRRLLAALKAASVTVVLTGHLHRDLTNRHDGMLFVTTRPVSFGLPKYKQPEGWTLVTVQADGNVRVEPRTIHD